ncbi:MAG: DUF3848 domain-containing protein [Firmicutes bacterium]|nr:DUF3848 domain-containing protein [Bacillota bacterium]
MHKVLLLILERKVIIMYEVSNQIYYKLNDEFDKYLDEIRNLSIDDIIEKSYETTIKAEIVKTFYYYFMGDSEEFDAISMFDNSLDYFYQKWMDSDTENIHTIIEDNVNNTLYNLVEEVEKIKDSKNYDLIKNIDELFNEISDIDLKNKLNDLFQINKFNVLNIDKILNLESDTKKLYHFFTSIEFKKSIADNIELSKKMSENILPNLQKLINKNKEIER